MNKPAENMLPLAPLLELLKSGGYEISVQQVLEIQSLLLSTPLIKSSPRDLKYILTPVIAKNEDEQNNIYRIIDNWVAEQTKKVIRPPHPLRVWMSRHFRQVFALKVAGFLLVIMAGVLVYFFAERKQPVKKPNQTTVRPPAATDTARSTPPAPPVTTSTSIAPRRSSAAATAKTIDIGPGRYERPIIPQPISNNLPVSLVFGFLGGAILYYIIIFERKRKMDMEKKKRVEEEIFLAPDEVEKLTVGREQAKTEAFEQVIVEFPYADHLVQRSAAFPIIKSEFKKLAPVEHPVPDIKKSIYSTIQHGGYRTVQYAAEWKPRKYIIICDNSNHDAHITQLLNYLVDWFRSAIAPVVHYSYSLEITLLKDGNNKVQYLEQLAQRTADHELIIVGYAHSFFAEADGRPRKKLIDIVNRWSSKSLITPVPLTDWSDKEAYLKMQDFHIIPAEANAIAMLARTISDGESLDDKLLAKTITDNYSLAHFNFHDADGLRKYLGNESLFQLVCSLAVYPTLNWRLTLALFDAIIKSDAEKFAGTTVSYELLLKVARIPWMHKNRLEDHVRLRLLESIDSATEIVARETILRLLDEVKYDTPRGSVAFKELRAQYNVNAFLLYSHNKETYKDYSASREVITHYWNDLNEKALKDHINHHENNLLPVNREGKHKTVEEFVMEEEEFDKYNVSLLKVALLVLPAFIIFIAFNIIKPGIVYPPGKYRNVSVVAIIDKMDSCAQKLTHATVMTNGMSSTHLLKNSNRYDTIRVADIPYTEAGESYDLEFWNGDKRLQSLSVLAKDSFFIVAARCSD